MGHHYNRNGNDELTPLGWTSLSCITFGCECISSEIRLFLDKTKNTMVKWLRERINRVFTSFFKDLQCFFFLSVPFPSSYIWKDVRFMPDISRFMMLAPNKLFDPIVPSIIEFFQHHSSSLLITNGMIDRMISKHLEVSEGPVIWDSSQEIIDCVIINSKFTWIVRIDGDCKAKTEKNRSRCFPSIRVVAQDNVAERILLKTDIPTMWKELHSLKNIESMTNSDTASLDSNIQVMSLMIFSLTSMINLLVVKMRELC